MLVSRGDRQGGTTADGARWKRCHRARAGTGRYGLLHRPTSCRRTTRTPPKWLSWVRILGGRLSAGHLGGRSSPEDCHCCSPGPPEGRLPRSRFRSAGRRRLAGRRPRGLPTRLVRPGPGRGLHLGRGSRPGWPPRPRADRRGELLGTALGAAVGGALFGPVVGAVADAGGNGARVRHRRRGRSRAHGRGLPGAGTA